MSLQTWYAKLVADPAATPTRISINLSLLRITAKAVKKSKDSAIAMYIQHHVESFILRGLLMPITARKRKINTAGTRTVNISTLALDIGLMGMLRIHLKVLINYFVVNKNYYRVMNKLRVSLIHMETRETLEEALLAARRNIEKAAEFNPNFIALPEYFSVPGFFENYPSAKDIFEKTYKSTIQFLQRISSALSSIYLIGGTVVEKWHNAYFNTCTLWRNGQLLGGYRKRSLINAEKRIGFSVGENPFVFSTEFCKIGILICADIFNYEAVEQTVSMGAEAVFLPVAALYGHPDVKGHPLSERIASEKGLFIIKIGNVRSGTRGGRSAVIAPWGVIHEAPDVPYDFILTADLDIPKLRSYKEKLSKTLSTSR